MFSWNKPTQPSAPKDPEAPIKGLMKNAPMPGGQIGENARLKRELLGSFKKGGHVKKTGVYKLHKGEEVIPAKKKEMAGKMKTCSRCGKAQHKEKTDCRYYGSGVGGMDI